MQIRTKLVATTSLDGMTLGTAGLKEVGALIGITWRVTVLAHDEEPQVEHKPTIEGENIRTLVEKGTLFE